MGVVDKWYAKIRKYLFFYRDGFYEFPVLANAPQMMLDSIQSMPFIKFYPQKKFYTTNTPFIQGSCHYQELEKGLWILMSDLEMKKNISFKMYYDHSEAKDYHFLTLYVNKGKVSFELPKINLDIENKDRSWTLFKAGSSAVNAHFKGQHSIFLSIYFTEDWMMNNVAQSGVLKNKTLAAFFESPENCLYLPNFLERKKSVYEPLIESILDKDENGVKDLLMVKRKTLEILSAFANELDDTQTIKTFDSTSGSNRRKLLKVENLLKESIYGKFPTIAILAQEVGMSETKLKADFKKMFGVTLFQYYSAQQMKYAKEMLENSNVTIKEVAYSLGYSNTSKFSAAFNKMVGQLPSEFVSKSKD